MLIFAIAAIGIVGIAVGMVQPMDVSSDRSVTSTVVAPNGTIGVSVEASTDEVQNLTLNESFDIDIAHIAVMDSGNATNITIDDNRTWIEANYTDTETISLEYRLTIDGNVSVGEVLSIVGTLTGDTSHQLETTEIDIVEDPGVTVWFSDKPTSVVAGEELAVNVTVENLGNTSTTVPVELTADGSSVDATEVSLDPFEQTTLTLNWQTNETHLGAVELELATPTHTDTLSIDVLKPATFEVSNLSAPSTATQFAPFDATVTIENIGDVAGAQTITLALEDGTELSTVELALDGGEEFMVSFSDIVIDEAGIHTLVVNSEDDSTDRPIVVESPDAAVSIPDQLLGANTEGTAAVFVSEVLVEEGWTIHLVDDTDTVIGSVTAEEDLDGETLMIDVNVDEHLPGSVDALITTGSHPIGESFPDEITPLATDAGVIFEASVDTSSLNFEDQTELVVIDRANLDGGDAYDPPIPYILGIHQLDADGELTLVGVTSLLQGTETNVLIDLETPITQPGTHDFIVKLHQVDLGDRGDPYVHVAGDEIVPYRSGLSVTVFETPTFTITNASAPSSVHVGDSIDVEVTISNVGDVGGTESVWVEFNGHIALSEVALEPGQNDTVTVSIPTSRADIGSQTIDIDVGDSSERLHITIEQAPESPATTSPVYGMTITAALLGGFGMLIALFWFSRRREMLTSTG